MSEQPSSQNHYRALKRLRGIVTVGALTVVLVHLIWPSLTIDAITLVLLLVALVPWLAPLFKSIELPGGWKVEFHELQQAAARADEAGLLAAKESVVKPAYAFQQIAQEDPNLALAGLRIEIEKRLVALAEKHGLPVRARGLGQLLRQLTDKGVIDPHERSILSDLTGLMNAAVHGASVDQNAAHWAMDVGPRLLRALDDL